MSIWYWPYELTPKRRLSAIAADAPRRGALIRVDVGFADVHPWPELGDEPLDEQLELLRRGETTALTRRSIAMAAVDGEARAAGRSAFEGLRIPPSHWPAAAGVVPPAFDTVKVKMAPGSTLDPALARFRLRLDFNATLSAEAFKQFIASQSMEILRAIDFVEDPCPYERQVWAELRKSCGVALALDRGDAAESVDVHVVKPAVQDVDSIIAPHSGLRTQDSGLRPRVVITSYMDHPIGQLGAAYVAAKSGIVETCGLLTHLLYGSDPFIERMRIEETRLVPAKGTGFGFDDLLESLPWKRLA